MSVAPLATLSSWHFGGVSRNLNVSYMRPVPVNTTVHIVCEVVNLGKNLCELLGTSWSAILILMWWYSYDHCQNTDAGREAIVSWPTRQSLGRYCS
jgi:hypothetical protein